MYRKEFKAWSFLFTSLTDHTCMWTRGPSDNVTSSTFLVKLLLLGARFVHSLSNKLLIGYIKERLLMSLTEVGFWFLT